MNEAQTGSKCPGEEVVEEVGAWKKNHLVSAASGYRLFRVWTKTGISQNAEDENKVSGNEFEQLLF